MEDIEINLKLEKADLQRYWRFWFRCFSESEKGLYMQGLYMVVYFPFLYLSMRKLNSLLEGNFLDFLFSTEFFALFVITFFFLFLIYFTRRIFNKELKTNKLLQETYKVIFSKDYIYYNSNFVDAKISWESFNSVVETKDDFYFCFSEIQILFVPKKFFNNNHDIFFAMELLKSKFKKESFSYKFLV